MPVAGGLSAPCRDAPSGRLRCLLACVERDGVVPHERQLKLDPLGLLRFLLPPPAALGPWLSLRLELGVALPAGVTVDHEEGHLGGVDGVDVEPPVVEDPLPPPRCARRR